ncbi:MAG: helix-turn-helix domain-containing protein [Sandaracinaceae bacterium]
MKTSALLTSTEVASLLGASPTSVKRWADEGLLRCVKTAGKHRRFAQEEVLRFQREHMTDGLGEDPTDIDGWIDDLVRQRFFQLQARCFAARHELGSWAAVCDRLGGVLEAIGARWEAGELTIGQEHVASQQLARTLTRIGETIPVADDAAVALLLTPAEEEHALGLALAEVALRELGWRPIMVGARTPVDEVTPLLALHRADLVAVSASRMLSKKPRLAAVAEALAGQCEPDNVTLVLGGSGAWPEEPRYGARIHRLTELASKVGVAPR